MCANLLKNVKPAQKVDPAILKKSPTEKHLSNTLKPLAKELDVYHKSHVEKRAPAPTKPVLLQRLIKSSAPKVR